MYEASLDAEREPVDANPFRAWGAVASMSMCVALLIAAEFMPVSLLTPIAADLHISEGLAGQAISVSGLFAVATSLLIAAVAACLDRRLVLMGLSMAMTISLIMIAAAPSFMALMAGASFGGFLFDHVAMGATWVGGAALLLVGALCVGGGRHIQAS